jgi:dUTPase
MKIAQAVLCPVASGRYVTIVEVDNVEETERGENGFGSTGLNL